MGRATGPVELVKMRPRNVLQVTQPTIFSDPVFQYCARLAGCLTLSGFRA